MVSIATTLIVATDTPMKHLKQFPWLPRDRPTTIAPASAPLRQIIRYAEWVLLLMMTLLYAIERFFPVTFNAGTLLPRVIVLNSLFLLLSFWFPIERPLWQRRAYIAIEMGLVLVASFMGIESSILLYFFLIKSCFFLSRREVVFLMIAVGAGYLTSVVGNIRQLQQQTLEQLANSKQLGELLNPLAVLSSASIEYLGISIFVILLGFVIVAERESRQRAETLAQEVKTLAAAVERTRIARDIHDALGHTLTTLGVQLEVAQKLRQRNPEQALDAIDMAKALTDQCLEDVRLALHTTNNSEFNFDQALRVLIDQVRQNTTLMITTEINLPSLPPQTSQQLYRIVQEGLTNVRKHASASCVKLRLYSTVERIHLTLTDDGRGFNPTLPCSGFGLQGIQQRVSLLAGDFTVKSAIGEGTQLEVSIPQ
ncbi:sensor histidine kinase [Stenomitos frigidus]|uniref:histidine kinase n=1 Tax=Stenomitos frigidus ULC18 TaxID=2107698 RepID=A0A2T1E0P5_9CYAN|nr:sensor histidine kinase [Stenomitos frigidus]PSB26307.1 sensor histidine kinase [Stenomitos frigidus ULC18]